MARMFYLYFTNFGPYPVLTPIIYDPFEEAHHYLNKIGKQVGSYAYSNTSLEKTIKKLNEILKMLEVETLEGDQTSIGREIMELKTKTLGFLKYYEPFLACAKAVSLTTQSLSAKVVNLRQEESKKHLQQSPTRNYTKRLPNDSFIDEVAQFLGIHDMLRMRRVCKEWRKQTDDFFISKNEKYLKVNIRNNTVVLDLLKIYSNPVMLKELISLINASVRNNCMRTRWFSPLCFWKPSPAEKFNHAIELTLSERKKENSPDDSDTPCRISLSAFLQT